MVSQLALVLCLAVGSHGFMSPSSSITVNNLLKPLRAEETAAAAESPSEEIGDLDLEDMFELFDAADEEVKTEEVNVLSQALPWMKRPLGLDTFRLAGDRGFDPLNFAKTKEDLIKFRNAEIKHSRLAMLAAAGWPVSERVDGALASLLGLESELTSAGMAPSLLNGGLGKISPIYWGLVVALAAAVEIRGLNMKSDLPGDFGFDPLGFYPKATDPKARAQMQESELRHGRTAMVAITAFAAQEFVSSQPVVKETPFFFEPIWDFAKELHLFDLKAGFYDIPN